VNYQDWGNVLEGGVREWLLNCCGILPFLKKKEKEFVQLAHSYFFEAEECVYVRVPEIWTIKWHS